MNTVDQYMREPEAMMLHASEGRNVILRCGQCPACDPEEATDSGAARSLIRSPVLAGRSAVAL